MKQVDRDVFKDPVGQKAKGSKRGRLTLTKTNGTYSTLREEDLKSPEENQLQTVFRNGELLVDLSFDQIRSVE